MVSSPPFVSASPEAGLSIKAAVSSCVDSFDGDLSPAAGDEVGGEGAVGTLLAGGVSGADTCFPELWSALLLAGNSNVLSYRRHARRPRRLLQRPPPLRHDFLAHEAQGVAGAGRRAARWRRRRRRREERVPPGGGELRRGRCRK